jgi:hypothetical protein
MISILIYFLMAIENNKNSVAYDVSRLISYQETRNRPELIGDKKFIDNYSVGLCQIRIKTALDIINKLVKNKVIKLWILHKIETHSVHYILLNPIINRYLCVLYIKRLIKRHGGNIKEAIISYNTGFNAKRSIRNGSGKKYLIECISRKWIYDIETN